MSHGAHCTNMILLLSHLANFRFERWGSDHGKAARAVFSETLWFSEISSGVPQHKMYLIK